MAAEELFVFSAFCLNVFNGPSVKMTWGRALNRSNRLLEPAIKFQEFVKCQLTDPHTGIWALLIHRAMWT